ncbi:MAG: protein kinase [Planctomycetes bacterium]|nr:protein kinase [Planctomycetota bacterium]
MFDIVKKLDKLYEKENWGEIIRIVEKLFLDGTEDVKILNDLAVAYRRKQMIDDAFKVCERIYFLNPESDIIKQSINLGIRYMRYHQIMGEILYRNGEYEKALKIFDSLKSLGSHFSDKFYLAAKIYTGQKKYDLALNEYQNLIKKCPHRIDDAIEGLLELIRADAANERAYNILYETYRAEGILQKEISLYEQAVENNKDIFDVYILGNFYRCSNQADKAVSLFFEYTDSDPNIPLFLGSIYLAKGEYQKAVVGYKLFCERNQENKGIALKCLEKALNLKKNDEELINDMVNFYFVEGNFKAAEEKLKSLINLKPANTAYQSRLEDLLLKDADQSFMDGNLEIAKEKLKELIKLNPGKSEYHKRINDIENFIIQNKIGEYEERLKRNNLPEEEANKIRFELGELYFKRNPDKENAISLFQKVAKSETPYKSEALCRIGLSFLSKGMVELADENFNRIRESNISEDKKVEMLYQIGNAYEEKGICDKARDAYRQILSYDIKYKDVAQRIERLPSNPLINKKDKNQRKLEDRYDQIEKIGAGGMGSIFRAKDKILGRFVALKVIREDFMSNTEATHRFIREAQSASALQHPGIVTIFDICVGEPMYIAMEYVDGGNLRDKLNKRPMSVQEFLGIAIEICDALDAAHSKGIIHRDIKPENIMLTKDGQIKITDFGLACINNASKMTMAGQILGTPLYMSPEQIKGRPVDNRSDIYSLGIVFYESLTGRVPFPHGDIGYCHIHETPTLPSLLNPDIPNELEKIIIKSIEKNPEDRYHNVREILEDINMCRNPIHNENIVKI